jgi:HEPN domain-containing protein
LDAKGRKTIERWIDQAQRQYDAANEHLAGGRHAESIQCAQQCAELSIKATLALLDIEYPRAHGLNRAELARIARQLRERQLLERLIEHTGCARHLPRLLCLVNFWAELYLIAKYGIQDEYLAAADELLSEKEARLAVEHASECMSAASELRQMPNQQLIAIVSPPSQSHS